MMNKQNEALRMAIEALENPNAGLVPHNDEWLSLQSIAIKACKEALEQPTVKEYLTAQEHSMTYEDGFTHGYEAYLAEYKEQPTQEPVAWMSEEVLPLNHIIKAVVRREPDEQYTIPLYTHPKEWQGLSDYEIFKTEGLYCVEEEYIKQFARAIEAKLKEKNTP